jgi:hypothetical protein
MRVIILLLVSVHAVLPFVIPPEWNAQASRVVSSLRKAYRSGKARISRTRKEMRKARASENVKKEGFSSKEKSGDSVSEAPSWEESLAILQALSEIFQTGPNAPSVWFESGGVMVKRGYPAVYRKKVSAKNYFILQMWYGATRGQTVNDEILRGGALLKHIKRAIQLTLPFVEVLREQSGKKGSTTYEKTKRYLRRYYFGPIQKLRKRAEREVGEIAVDELLETHGRFVAPDLKMELKKLNTLAKDSFNVLVTVTDTMDALQGPKLDTAYSKILEEMASSDPVGEHLKGMNFAMGIRHLKDVLGAVQTITQISDPKERKKLFDEKLGRWGYVEDGTDLGIGLLSILQGVVSGTTGLVAGVARVSGHVAEASKLVAAASKVSGGIGKAMSVLQIAKGVATLLGKDGDKLDGALDVIGGGSSLIGGPVGGGIGGAILGFKAGVAVLRKGFSVKASLISIDLQKAFKTIKYDGWDIVAYANRVLTAQALLKIDHSIQRTSSIQAEHEKYIKLLRWKLDSCMEQWANPQKRVSQPGYWVTLRSRFGKLFLRWKAGSFIAKFKTVPELVLQESEELLRVMTQVMENYPAILEEEALTPR